MVRPYVDKLFVVAEPPSHDRTHTHIYTRAPVDRPYLYGIFRVCIGQRGRPGGEKVPAHVVKNGKSGEARFGVENPLVKRG